MKIFFGLILEMKVFYWIE